MIARPKISRNERKTTEIGAFEVGNSHPFPAQVHPVFRFYDGAGALRDVLHVDEELAVFFLYRKHRASALFLDAVVDDLRRGRDDRALGHVLLEPGDGGLRVRVDAYE